MLKLYSNEYTLNGQEQSKQITAGYEISINNPTKEQAILTNSSSYNMYYCDLKK